MGSYTKYRDEELKKDPQLKSEYDALEPEYDIIQAMIEARKSQNITQKELSERNYARRHKQNRDLNSRSKS